MNNNSFRARAIFLDIEAYYNAVETEAQAICYDTGGWEYKNDLVDYLFMELIESLQVGFFITRPKNMVTVPTELTNLASLFVCNLSYNFRKDFYPIIASYAPVSGFNRILCTRRYLVLPESS